MMGIGMGFGGIGLVLMLLFWGGLIVGGALLVKTVFTGSQQNHFRNSISEQSSPRKILDQRYARGEITREQFEIMKTDLSE